MSGRGLYGQQPRSGGKTYDDEEDAKLAARLVRHLCDTFDNSDARYGAWAGDGERETLRRTCHAVEVLHQLNLDDDIASIVHKAAEWLIELPICDNLPGERQTWMRLYPSRFKTLAYVGRFDNGGVRNDFASLVERKHFGGMIKGAMESDILASCVVLDTLLTLGDNSERRKYYEEADALHQAIVTALRRQLKTWCEANGTAPKDAEPPAQLRSAARPSRKIPTKSEIDNPRDLSYVLGLLSKSGRLAALHVHVDSVASDLIATIEASKRKRYDDLLHVLYAALHLADLATTHKKDDAKIRITLRELLTGMRARYANPDAIRAEDIMNCTLILRVLMAYHGPQKLARSIVTHRVRDAEQQRSRDQISLKSAFQEVIRDSIEIVIGDSEYEELTGGFTDDKVFRVNYTVQVPQPERDDHAAAQPHPLRTGSLIIKRSTGEAFRTAAQNYNKVPTAVQDFFVQPPSGAAQSKAYVMGDPPTYYLPMQDLTGMRTFHDLFNEFDEHCQTDQFTLTDPHARRLRAAVDQICQMSFSLFSANQLEPVRFASKLSSQMYLSVLYLSRIEGKLLRAVDQLPWLKNLLDGFSAQRDGLSDQMQRFRALGYYLAAVPDHAEILKPRYLGLTHGDFHSRNIMLNNGCTHVKLIDLDKVSESGDYMADLGNLIADLCVYRPVSEPRSRAALPHEDIAFDETTIRKQMDGGLGGTSRMQIKYPSLSRPASRIFQKHLLDNIERFARELGDEYWKPRLWLSTATALLVRLGMRKVLFDGEDDGDKDTAKRIASVLYGEATRLLHELNDYLKNRTQVHLAERIIP
jgi:hypothetical protein